MLNDPLILFTLSFILGAFLGSFLNVCIYRVPNGISIIYPRSHCISCKTPLRLYNNIPIISFLLQGGRCKDCGARISPRYLIVEILSGLICALSVLKFGITLQTVFYLIFLFSLVVVTFIDIEHMIIPNVITIPGIFIGVAYGAVRTDWGDLTTFLSHSISHPYKIASIIVNQPAFDSIFGAILGGGVLYLIALIYVIIRKREGMGMGDVKLLAMIGAFLGWKSIIYVTLVSSLLGTIVGLAIIVCKRGDIKYAMPFGPFLSLAAALYLFINERYPGI
ncbi:MAG: prepilin peptidase [Deltaproteobacteria bacterium]|nr:prepilin peptidase [Deltaproteobacteria bacterium]